MTMDIGMTMRFYAYDQPFTVVLPAEALDAEEVPPILPLALKKDYLEPDAWLCQPEPLQVEQGGQKAGQGQAPPKKGK